MTSVKLEARSPKTGQMIYNWTSKTESNTVRKIRQDFVMLDICNCTCNLSLESIKGGQMLLWGQMLACYYLLNILEFKHLFI